MHDTTPPARSDVPTSERWNDAALFAEPADWDAAADALEARLDELRAFQGTLGRGPDRLADWLALLETLDAELGRLRVYATMASNVDAYDEEARARAERVKALDAELREASAFAEPELVALGLDRVRGWIQADPRLQDRERWLQRLERDAPYLRSPEIEALLGALRAPFSGAPTSHGLLANAELDVPPARDAEGRTHEVTQSTVDALKASQDRALRRDAWSNYADAHLARKRTMASLLVTGARQNNLLARTRGHGDALDHALTPLEVPRSVVDALLDTFQRQLPVWHRYFDVKRRHLGLETLRPWDIDAPATPATPHVPYETGVAWIAEALAPLGPAYVQALRRGALEERWVDRAPNAGKRMGAFSTGWAGTPPYVMMSYTHDLHSTSTLAHELGHAMHSYLSWRAQPYPYARYTLFAAEVASNFMQAMLRDHLFRAHAGDRDFELALIDETMANFGRYFLIMPTLMRFELELHRRAAREEGTSADDLSNLLADLFAAAYGPSVDMDRERVGITWAQFHTHLYARFYVFQYATGIAGAHAFARRILDGEAGAAEAYLDFLKEGGRSDPLTAMRRAGVDLASPEPVEAAFGVLERHVDRFEALVDQEG
ncbi:MAG: oligoendopeptidase F [Trueperaceae bacterium]|nr:oligoendopeptidase F [Trueperaceae bacterium]